MLIKENLNGSTGAQERATLHGMLAVGNEFMTSSESNSTVQRSGEFISIETKGGGHLRLAALFETSDALRQPEYASVVALGDDEPPPARGEHGYVVRSLLMTSEQDDGQGPQAFRTINAQADSRLARFTLFPGRIDEVDHATLTGRPRFFSLGDGRALLVRELSDPGDTRYFTGIDTQFHSRRRRRVTAVQLLPVNLDTGSIGKTPLLEIPVHSGLGFDPGISLGAPGPGTVRVISYTPPSVPGTLVSDTTIYAALAGVMWGSRVAGQDPSETYAIAEPATAKDGDKSYMSLVAVHGLPEDSYNLQSSALFQLTCTRTTPDGVEQTKITLPPATRGAGFFNSAVGMELVRLAPSTLVLAVKMWEQAQPTTTTFYSLTSAGSTAFFWSDDNGATWADINTAGFLDNGAVKRSLGSIMARDADTALVFSGYEADSLVGAPDVESVAVYQLTRTGVTRISTIPGSQFSEGLHSGTPLSFGRFYPPYLATAYGGGLRVKDKNLLWMQFDPRWVFASTNQFTIDYPSSRAQLMVSADGGVTWVRRFMPQPWAQRLGFVVSLDQTTAMVPVYEGRRKRDDGSLLPLTVTLYTTHDFVKWRPTQWRLRLPPQTSVDGQLLPGTPDYDYAEVRRWINRGELFPILSIRDEQAQLLPMNPGRPWIADHRKTGPSYG